MIMTLTLQINLNVQNPEENIHMVQFKDTEVHIVLNINIKIPIMKYNFWIQIENFMVAGIALIFRFSYFHFKTKIFKMFSMVLFVLNLINLEEES